MIKSEIYQYKVVMGGWVFGVPATATLHSRVPEFEFWCFPQFKYSANGQFGEQQEMT